MTDAEKIQFVILLDQLQCFRLVDFEERAMHYCGGLPLEIQYDCLKAGDTTMEQLMEIAQMRADILNVPEKEREQSGLPEKWTISLMKSPAIEEKDKQLQEEELLNQDIYYEVMSDFLFDERVQQNQDIDREEESLELLADFFEIEQQMAEERVAEDS